MSLTQITLKPVAPRATGANGGGGKPLPSGLATLGIVVLVVAMLLSGLFLPGGGRLLGIALSLTALILLLGRCISHRIGGALINQYNVMSLARFQMALWTVLVLGAYLACALARLARGDTNPLDIEMDWHLWALMGISTTSLIGAPLVLSTKKDQDPHDDATAKTALITQESTTAVDQNRQGLIYANSSSADAKFTDLFEGDEVGNTTQVDLAKVQMFLFTIITGLAFFWSVLHSLASPDADLSKLPQLSDGTVWLLGISHAGYLSSKGITHTKTA
jgi:hypothetical protein